MDYQVSLDAFSGPLDLLLHLIKESKVDIMDIQIEVVANQYLAYIQKLEELNLNVASEYLVMASELVEMKSKLLLPKKTLSEEEEEEEDPKDALIRKLLEYEQYKKMTENFKELESIRSEIYTKTPESLKEYIEDGANMSIDVSLDELMDAFSKFLKRKQEMKPLSTKVTKKEITVEERRSSIRHILKEKKRVLFTELFDVFTKEYMVVTFLAILEMARSHEACIKQDFLFDAIIVEVV